MNKLQIVDVIVTLSILTIAVFLTVIALQPGDQTEEQWQCTAVDAGVKTDSWTMSCHRGHQ